MTDIKADAFIRISGSRLPRAIKSIELLGNLSNRGNYHFTDDQALDLIRQIDTARDNLAKSFKIDHRVGNTAKPAGKEYSLHHNKYLPEAKPNQEQEDPDILKPLAKSWVAWSLGELIRGNRSEAIEMLKIGLKHQRAG